MLGMAISTHQQPAEAWVQPLVAPQFRVVVNSIVEFLVTPSTVLALEVCAEFTHCFFYEPLQD